MMANLPRSPTSKIPRPQPQPPLAGVSAPIRIQEIEGPTEDSIDLIAEPLKVPGGGIPLFPGFIPAEPSWTGPRTATSAVVMTIQSDRAAGLNAVLTALLEFIQQHAPETLVGTDLGRIVDETMGARKHKDAARQYRFTADSLTEWASRPIHASRFELDHEKWQLRGSNREVRSDRHIRLEIGLMQPSGEEQNAFVDSLGQILDEVPGWWGFVGIGEGWLALNAIHFPVAASLSGYGPAIVVSNEDAELDAVDEALIQVTSLVGDRVLIRAVEGADLVSAVSEGRRIVWRAFGFLMCDYPIDSGTVFLEGPTARDVWMDAVPSARGLVESEALRRCFQFLNGEILAAGVGPQVVEALLAEAEAEHLVLMLEDRLEAWARAAAALSAPESEEWGVLPSWSVMFSDGVIRVSHGRCSHAARLALDSILNGSNDPGFKPKLPSWADWRSVDS